MDTSMEQSYERLALRETLLLKKIQLLQDELFIVRAEMEFVRKYSFPEQQRVFITPSAEMHKVKAIPELPATGKEASNPVIAVDLLKIQTEVQTSTTLASSSNLNLRPNGGIQIPKKTEGQTSAVPIGYKAPKAYYVVFNGPNSGIYTTWNVAEQAVKGFSGVKHKKYKSFEEASAAARIYTNAEFKPPLELICSAEALRPTYSGALTKTKSSKISIGTIPGQQRNKLLERTDEDVLDTNYSGFDYLYKLGRNATEKEFAEEHYFTTDKKNVSYYNFYPNAHPEMVYEAYQYGLLSQVYPSDNLLEISKFSKEFRGAVKAYKKNCLKSSDKEIYLKIQSTNIFWDEDDEPVQPYHYVQIGVIKEKIYQPSQAMEAKLDRQDLQELAEQKLLVLIGKVFSINKEDKLKVNLSTTNCLITSYSHKGLSDEDFKRIQAYRAQLVQYNVFGYHYPSLCSKIMKEMEKRSIIVRCDKGCPTTTKDSPDKGKEKLVEEKEIPTTKEKLVVDPTTKEVEEKEEK